MVVAAVRDRQAGRLSGQGDVDPRGRHPARRLPPGLSRQDHCEPGRRQGRRPGSTRSRALRSLPAGCRRRSRRASTSTRSIAAVETPYDIPELPRRICPCRAAGCADRLLARRRPEQQRVRGRMRDGRTCAQGRQGSGRIPKRRCWASTPRALAVLNLAAEKSGWGQPLPARVGRGVCLQPSFASFIATVVEAEIDDRARSRCAASPRWSTPASRSIPIRSKAQIEGGLIFGLTAALYGEITIDKGRVQQSNFHDYRMMRINETPKIEVIVVKSGEAPGGIGEAGVNGRTTGAAQRDLRRNRRGAAAPADRSETSGCGEEGMSGKMRILTKPRRDRHRRGVARRLDHPRARSARLRRRHQSGAGGLSRRQADRRTGQAGESEPGRARRVSARRRPTAWSATPSRARRNIPAGSASSCRSARSIRPTSRRTRTPASAITATRISSTRSSAARAMTARGSIRPCPTRPTPT